MITFFSIRYKISEINIKFNLTLIKILKLYKNVATYSVNICWCVQYIDNKYK